MTSPTDEALRLPRLIPVLFAIALLGLVGLTAWQWRDGPPVSANLLQLLPSGAPGELEQLAESIWNSLNCDNKVSLYVSTVELETGKRETVIYNKHLGGKAE